MIPLRLYVKNFLSYGEAVDPLDFTGFKLACLTGKNGHGKSALLDAMTWAVWGEARKADFSRTPDSDLLRLNADEMTVEFTFDLNGYEYTVERGFKRGKKQGKSTLEFSVRENHAAPSRLLTGSSKRETQAKIIETVGLDYRTFINSSFLKQGKSDEFTRQSPKDRKDILTNILGLSHYDQLLEETKLQLNKKKNEENVSLQRIGSIEEELKEEAAILQQESELKESLANQDHALAKIFEDENKTLEKVNHLRVEKEKVESWKREEQSLQTRKKEYETRKHEYTRELSGMQCFIDRKSEIETNFKRYEEINQTLKLFLETETQCQQLLDQKQQIEKQINEQHNTLREKLAGLQSEEKQVQTAAQECSLWIQKEHEITTHYQQYALLIQQDKELHQKKPAFDDLQSQIQHTENEIGQHKQKLLNRVAELKGQTQSLPEKQKELAAMQERVQGLTALEQQRDQMQEQLQTLEEKGQDARSRIESGEDKIKQLQTMLQDTRDIADLIDKGSTEDCPVCKQPLNEHAQEDLKQHYTNEIARLTQEIAAQEKRCAEAESAREQFGKQYKTLRAELETAQKRMAAIQHEKDTVPRKQEDIQQLMQYQQEMKSIEEQIHSNRFAEDLQKQLEHHQHAFNQLGYDPKQHSMLLLQLQEQRQTEADWKTLHEKKTQAALLEKRMGELSSEKTALLTTIETQAFCQNERKERAALEEKIKPLQAELEKRKTLHDEQDQLKNASADYQNLQNAQTRMPVVAKEREEAEKRIVEANEQIQTLQTQLQQSESLLKQYDEQNTAYQKIVSERKQIELDRNQTYQAIGIVTAKLEALQKKKEETKTLRKSLQDTAQEIRYLEILKKAFSRDGIPAMMVEQALPELEEDANRLLRRLTHGACTIQFQTQRESKTGGIKETLDLLISDEMGTRDYDMFSGGEAFRTDLAVRIALSQLLCRRAGSRLQLLVIDEGFGTQDADGLSNIVEAINEIQDEFEKVLVVTHIEELKDRFTDRIEVFKDPGLGSRFQVVHAL